MPPDESPIECGRKSGIAAVILWLLSSGCTAAPQQEPEAGLPQCSIELLVYSPVGVRLPFVIKEIRPENMPSVNMVSHPNPQLRVHIDGGNLARYSGSRGRRWVVVFEDSNGRTLTETVHITGCTTKVALQYGSLDLGFDVSGSSVTGRLAGCKLDANWWIRVAPMFGNQESAWVTQGVIRPNGGDFIVEGQLRGTTNLFIVGTGTKPLKTVAFPLTVGANNSVGVIDMSEACPGDRPQAR